MLASYCRFNVIATCNSHDRASLSDTDAGGGGWSLNTAGGNRQMSIADLDQQPILQRKHLVC